MRERKIEYIDKHVDHSNRIALVLYVYGYLNQVQSSRRLCRRPDAVKLPD